MVGWAATKLVVIITILLLQLPKYHVTETLPKQLMVESVPPKSHVFQDIAAWLKKFFYVFFIEI